MIKIYDRKAKQNLLFDKSQSRDFDGQIADIPLSFIRYILLSFYERTYYGMTIGGLFNKLSQAAVEENVVADLSAVFMELLEAFAQFAGIDLFDVLSRTYHQTRPLRKLITSWNNPQITSCIIIFFL